MYDCQSQWPRGLRRNRLLRMWVRIPPGAWMSVCRECCVLSDRRLCDEPISRPDESYRQWCVVVCDLESLKMRRPWPTGGYCKKKICVRLSSAFSGTAFWLHIFGILCSWVRTPWIKFKIVQQDVTVFSLLYFCRQHYMFRMLTPIIRSWYSCNYSFWYYGCLIPTQQRERMAVDSVDQCQKL